MAKTKPARREYQTRAEATAPASWKWASRRKPAAAHTTSRTARRLELRPRSSRSGRPELHSSQERPDDNRSPSKLTGLSRCWCMYWRTGPNYRKVPGNANRSQFRKAVKQGPPPGLVAFDGTQAVGWCQLTPRAALPHLAKEWRLKPVDTQPVWSLTCFYIRKTHRHQGVTTALIQAAVKAAKRAGAPALEAYPFDRAVSPSTTSTGVASTFARLGFKTVARHIPARLIVRHDLKAIA